jgi:hypothetical protein
VTEYLFMPLLAQSKHVDLALLEHMQNTFDVSLPAAAICIAEANVEPVIIACYSRGGRRWFKRSRDVPDRWFPVDQIDPDTYAADVLAGKRDRAHVSPIGADAWFDADGISEYEVKEQSIRLSDDNVLVIIRITEEAMQEDYGRRAWSSRQSR